MRFLLVIGTLIALGNAAHSDYLYSAVRLDNSTCATHECTIGDVVADALVASSLRSSSRYGLRWPQAVIAIVNGGSFRAPLHRGFIRRSDIDDALPFKNTVVWLRVKGSSLRRAFENSVSSYGESTGTGRFLQVSGVKVQYDVTRPKGSRVKSLLVRSVTDDIASYESVNERLDYVILTTDFIAGGGDDYVMLRDEILQRKNLGLKVNDLVYNYLNNRYLGLQELSGRILV